MEDDFQSLSKGVFVVPFNPDRNNEAGPSRPVRPLKRVYDETFRQYRQAHLAYEKDRMEEQLDDVADWLDACNAPPVIKRVSGVKRLRIAIMQNISDALPDQLPTLLERAFTLQARDATDLTMAVRNIAVGFVGEKAFELKRNGRSGMEEVEGWYGGLKSKQPLLLHISQAQLVPVPVLSELLYILASHPDIPFRVLLSVSSTALFLGSWQHVEPSLIDMTVIQAGRNRKRGGAVNAILKNASDARRVPLSVTEDLATEIRAAEEMTGGGAAAALKTLKWSLLQHSFNSPLASMTDDDTSRVRTIVNAIQDGKTDVPGRDLLQIDSHPDQASTLDPAPRLSILHALSKPSAFHEHLTDKDDRETTPTPQAHPGISPQKKKRKFRSPTPPENPDNEEAIVEGGDLRELEVMFGLWQSAGRNVNLWDWLEGFRGAMVEADQKDEAEKPKEADTGDTAGEDNNASEEGADGEKEPAEDKERESAGKVLVDEETQDRLHAAFVRFCEEARMLGLVRARGGRTAKRADEVVKGIGLV